MQEEKEKSEDEAVQLLSNCVQVNLVELQPPSETDQKKDAKSLECPFMNCLKLFNSSKELKSHCKTHISVADVFTCTYENCQQSFKKQEYLEKHLLGHTLLQSQEKKSISINDVRGPRVRKPRQRKMKRIKFEEIEVLENCTAPNIKSNRPEPSLLCKYEYCTRRCANSDELWLHFLTHFPTPKEEIHMKQKKLPIRRKIKVHPSPQKVRQPTSSNQLTDLVKSDIQSVTSIQVLELTQPSFSNQDNDLEKSDIQPVTPIQQLEASSSDQVNVLENAVPFIHEVETSQPLDDNHQPVSNTSMLDEFNIPSVFNSSNESIVEPPTSPSDKANNTLIPVPPTDNQLETSTLNQPATITLSIQLEDKQPKEETIKWTMKLDEPVEEDDKLFCKYKDCGLKFSKSEELDRHFISHFTMLAYQDKKFISPRDIRAETRVLSPKTKKVQKLRLLGHSICPSNIRYKQFPCDKCNLSYKYKYQLNKHLARHAKNVI